MREARLQVVIISLLLMMSIVSREAVMAGKVSLPSQASAASLSVEGKVALGAMTALIDAQIGRMVSSLELLAISEEVKSGDWEKMKPLLAGLQQRGVPSAVFYARPEGSYFTVDKDLVDQSLKDRAYFSRLMAGKRVLGELVVSKSTGNNAAVVAVPITVDGKVTGALGSSIYLDQLSGKIKQALRLPSNMLFFALDAHGRTALNWKKERVMVKAANLGSPSLTKAVAKMLSQREGMVSYTLDGKRRDVIFQTSSLTGWRCALGIVR